jgi:hypothetical protein
MSDFRRKCDSLLTVNCLELPACFDVAQHAHFVLIICELLLKSKFGLIESFILFLLQKQELGRVDDPIP